MSDPTFFQRRDFPGSGLPLTKSFPTKSRSQNPSLLTSSKRLLARRKFGPDNCSLERMNSFRDSCTSLVSLVRSVARVGFALRKTATLNVARQRHLLIRGAEKLRVREDAEGLRGEDEKMRKMFDLSRVNRQKSKCATTLQNFT